MSDINYTQIEMEETYKKEKIFSVIESLLFVSGEPIYLKDMAIILGFDKNYLKNILNLLMSEYENEQRGIKLICMNESYQLVTKPENQDYVRKLLKTNVRQSLSQAALETLSIIAYRQPVTRIDIDEIRGVKSERAIQTLIEKGIVRESGRLNVPGKPILYATTDEFLKYFSLKSLEELPSIDNV